MKQEARIKDNFQFSTYFTCVITDLIWDPAYNYLYRFSITPIKSGIRSRMTRSVHNKRFQIKTFWQRQGFTLIEMVLTIGIIALLAAFSIPVYGNLFTRNDLDDAKMIVVQALRRAELSAQAEDGANINSTTANPLWGVDIQNGNVTVFRGQTYAGRVQSDDEVYPIGNTVTVTSSPVDIFFSPETGFSTSASTVSATLTVSSGESRTISVSPNGGKVEY